MLALLMLAIALSEELRTESGQDTVTFTAGKVDIHCSTTLQVT